ncbi:MAG: hypothetical protein AAGA66_03295 [Bacteroidota bacterium]
MGIAFSNVLNPLEGLVKLLINTFNEEDFNKPSKSFVTMYNPQSFDHQVKPIYEKTKVSGNKEIQKFKYIQADTLSLELLFDATGASVSDGSKYPIADLIGEKVDLQAKVKKDKSTYDAIQELLLELYNAASETHKPRYVEIIWGSLNFRGVLESSKTTHSLFGADGRPIRSKVACVFKNHESLAQQAARTKKNSPDLTRFKQVKDEDNLPLIAQDTYEDPRFYLELARVNRINNFRALRNGSRLRLPPVEK